ncbi:HesA/MoeB/ThiF family protein [Actinomadura sp. CNU-125]|uniref:HesA/MoeB/ThiF family protein n=1 Tax=Actinomadura sp. CNU-125 TaxID=1904961 RepID=UPI001177964C|nr:ThiF family adenylyltransferase [Actinomadura sp. CNU-125]
MTVRDTDRHDHQVRAFGAAAQRRLRALTVAVVGVGGIGSLVVQGLAHMGAGRLIVVDPDHVEPTNLNRLAGATDVDARSETSKIEVAARLARSIDPDIAVHQLPASVLDADTWRELRCADVIVGAVDEHAPRWALNTLAVQYRRHYIDTGTLVSDESGTLDVSGHVATVTPDGPCLLCLSGYDPSQASMELDPGLTAAKRAAGYLSDAPDEPAPSVMFLNQAVAAVALGELLNIVGDWHAPRPYTLVDLGRPSLTAMHAEASPDCPACGPDSTRGLCDTAPPPCFTPPEPPPPM